MSLLPIPDGFEQKYCGGCGRKMNYDSTGAENFYYIYESGRSYPYRKYSETTGRRQIVRGWKCPSYKEDWRTRFFGSKHESYFIDKVIEID